jgi:uncharacterized protein
VKKIKNVGIFINTPAQYHFYKNIAYELNKLGIATFIVYRDYGETKSLVVEGGNEYFRYSNSTPSFLVKSMMMPLDILRISNFLKSQNVDIVTGFGGYDCFSASLLGVPCIEFNDSEPYINLGYSVLNKIYLQFTDVIVTPTFFNQDLGSKQIKVNSIKETAYLDPKYYIPDKSILKSLDLDKNENYAILRFNSFDAAHDIGISGFNMESKIELVKRISPRMKVFISFEGRIENSLSKYQIKIPKSKIHDAIAFASLLVTDTQTIATEAAILGTPVIRSNAFIGPKDMGIFKELEKRQLLYNIKDSNKAIEKAEEISNNCQEFKAEWIKRSKDFLGEIVCITDVMTDLISNYPMQQSLQSK